MRTDKHIQAWLRCIAVMLLTVVGFQNTMAQEIEGGEAFYIYQNDGHFDGFFYDQVKEIRCSRLDTTGIEHDEYVSQEIVTEDSVYRFMLTAIDSVSFVQPEIKFAKGVRFMRDEGMMDYFLDAVKGDNDQIIVSFRTSMPASLRPKVGEVLQCPDLEGWEEGTLVAKVQKVEVSGPVLLVTCGYIDDLKDVFEQFITVEQVRNVQTPQGRRTVRRMAGINTPRRAEGNVSDLTLFNFNYTFEGKTKLYDKLNLQLVLNTGFGMTLTAAYKITLTEFYIKTLAKMQMSVGGSFGVDGELYDSADLTTLPGIGDFIAKFSKIPFPANFPVLFVNVVPIPFTRAEAHLNLGVSIGAQVKASSFMLEIKDKWPYVDLGLNFIAPFLPYSAEGEKSFSINAQINGSLQTGLKFPIEVSTLPWVKKVCFVETGMKIFVGPKVSGALNFDILKTGDGAYEALKDSKIDLSMISVDNEISGKATLFGKEWDTKRTRSWTYGNLSFLLFPEFGDVSYNIIGDHLDEIQCSCDVSGLTCLPEKVGIGIYCKENESDRDFSKLYDTFFMPGVIWYDGNFNKVEGGFTKVEPGEYRLRPIISLAGVEGLEKLLVPVYDKEQAVIIEQRGLTLEPEEASFEEDGGELTVKLGTKESLPITATPNADWIKVDVIQPVPANGGGSMKIKIDPNDEDRFRQGAITVKQGSAGGDEKVFTVKQYGGLQLSVNKLDFDPEGGTGVVEILTSRKPITISTQGADDWINYDLYDRTLTVRANENKGAQRTAVIIISAWSEKYQGISTIKLTVTQKGLVDVVIEPSSLSFEATGSTQRVNISLGQNTTFNDVIVGDKEKEWIVVEKKDNYFNVTALPNTQTTERQCIIDCSVSTTGDDGKPNTILLPVTITQTFGTATVQPSEVHFGAEGGSQEVKVDVSTYPYCGAMVGDDGNGWVDASVSSGGVVTITAKPNAGTQQRECTVQCFVSGEKNPSEDQIIKLPVKVVQAGRSLAPVTPDGDKSPFKYISITASRLVGYISSTDGRKDTLFQYVPSFVFSPENAHFTVSYGKNSNHYECVGYEEWTANDMKSKATLSFDIEKKTKKVKNLQFAFDSESVLTMNLPGATSNTTINGTMMLQTNDFPLKTNESAYKYGKYTAGEGLSFSSFNSVSDFNTIYIFNELGKELYGEEGIDPVSEHVTYPPSNDPRDYIELTISYKDGQGEPFELEWPSDAVMNSLESAGLPVYEGGTPPTLDGTYSLSAPKLVADKTGDVGEMEGLENIVLRFSGQNNGQVNVDVYFIINGMATEASGEQPALISGSGNQFSICMPNGYGSATILSGVVSDGAINDLYFSSTSMTNADEYIIIKDGNGSSSKTTWSPGGEE